jgi:hypothetical protein
LRALAADPQDGRTARHERTGAVVQAMCQLQGCTSIHQKQSNTINWTFNRASRMRKAEGGAFFPDSEKCSALPSFRAIAREFPLSQSDTPVQQCTVNLIANRKGKLGARTPDRELSSNENQA